MPSPTSIDVDALLAPIPGDDPSGVSLPYETRETLDQGRKEVDPEDFAADDPQRPDQPKRADWPGITKLAVQTLAGTSKDVMTAARLAESLTRTGGFAGLRDGLTLLRRLVDECWDRLRPTVEDGDLDARAAPFFWLDDPDRGALFPNTVRAIPLVVAGDGAGYGWRDWRRCQDGKGPVTLDAFEKAILVESTDAARAAVADATESLEALDALRVVLDARFGPTAPALVSLRQAVADCLVLARQVLARKAGSEPEAPAAESGPIAAVSGRASTRDEIYRQVAELAETLRRLEPHSPIPYLLSRAVELGALPFPDLLRALVRNPDVLGELGRELGLKEPPA